MVGGLVATSDEELAAHLGFVQNSAGAVPGPFDCYLVQRGLKTLAVRLDRQCTNARLGRGAPPRPSSRERGLLPRARRSIPVTTLGGEADARLRSDGLVHAPGGEAAALDVAGGTRLFTLAESLGAVESLIEHPAQMTHASVTGSELEVDPSLIRLSVGLESAEDLLEDLDRALALATQDST